MGVEGAGANDEDFERHGDGDSGGDENGDQAEAFEPAAKALRAALLGALQKPAAAVARDEKQGGVADNGTRDRDGCVEVRAMGLLYRQENEVGIERVGDGNAGGIEEGEHQQSPGPNGNKEVGKVAEQHSF